MPTDDDLDFSTCCIVLVCCMCLAMLIYFLWHNDNGHRRRYSKLVKKFRTLAKHHRSEAKKVVGGSDKQLKRAKSAEAHAIALARNSTPSRAMQKVLLEAARNHTLLICAGLGVRILTSNASIAVAMMRDTRACARRCADDGHLRAGALARAPRAPHRQVGTRSACQW